MTQENKGVVSTTNFPLYFEDDENIRYSLAAPEDHIISLKFINFEIEDTTDFVKVSAGLHFLKKIITLDCFLTL